MQADFFKHYEADVKYIVGQKERHWLAPPVPRKLEEHLYGKLEPSSSEWADTGVLVKFDQEEFVEKDEWYKSGLEKYGYVYYPKTCIQ